MFFLDESARAILDAIIATGYGEEAFKIDNSDGCFMPLHVEVLPDIDFPEVGRCGNLSLCHYGKMNGDMMRDPEMCFATAPDGERFAYYFRNDYAGAELDAQHPDTGRLNWRKVHEHNEFAQMWLCNISDQQNLNPAENDNER